MDQGSSDPAATLRAIQKEIDAVLAAGGRPDPAAWAARHPELAGAIGDLAELRAAIHDEQLEAVEDENLADVGRERLLAAFESEVQDALNRGEAPDLVAWQARYPHLAPELERMRSVADFLQDALTGEAPPPGASRRREEARAGLGRYRLLRRIATHAVGPVYLGECDEPPPHRELMILRPIISPAQGWRVLREADQSRSLQGPGLVRVLEVGEVRGVRFIAGEHVRGISLAQAIGDLAFHGGGRTLRQVLPPEAIAARDVGDRSDRSEARAEARVAAASLGLRPEHAIAAVRLAAEVARILARAHLQGRVHFDLSPGAVVVGQDGRPAVRWFGLARHFRGLRAGENVIGVYRAPELAFALEARADWRADVYGVGAVLCGLLLLEPPMHFDTAEPRGPEVLERARAGLAANLDLLPAPVGDILRRALAIDPAERHADCVALAEALDRAADGLAAATGSGPAPESGRPSLGGRVRKWLRRSDR